MVKSVHEHQAIYEAIVQRDGAAAEARDAAAHLVRHGDQLASIATSPELASAPSAVATSRSDDERAGQ